jgi:cytochrome c
MTRNRLASIAALALAASFLLAHVHPFGDAGLFVAKATQPPIMEHSSVPPDVRILLAAKCADCHSAQTRSPVYGHFAPVSWLMERDIVEARKALNLSLWDTYSTDQQETFKAKIVQMAKTHEMPPLQYQVIHWNARISTTDVKALAGWKHGTPYAAGSGAQTATDGDFIRGQALFEKRCTGCHALTQNHEGPRLQGVYGRASGSVPGFPYSEALRKANVVWNDESLEKWLTDPDAFLPGNNMDFLVARPQERKDIIAFLKQSAGA